MRCPTCGDTPHPGYVAYRETDIGGGLVRRSLVPCPDCGGSRLAAGETSAAATVREVVGSADQVVAFPEVRDATPS